MISLAVIVLLLHKKKQLLLHLTPTWVQQVQTCSLGAAESHSEKRRKSLSEAENDTAG